MQKNDIIQYFGVQPIKYLYDGGDLYFSYVYERGVLLIGTTVRGMANLAVSKLTSELFEKLIKERPELRKLVAFHDWSGVSEIENLSDILLILYRLVHKIGKRHGEIVISTSLKKGSMINASIKAAFYLVGNEYYLEETRESFLKRYEEIQRRYLGNG